MGLESGTYIGALNASNPAATDGLGQADNHIRLIKSTIKNTFPNINGIVSSSPADLNKLDTYSGNTDDLNLLSGNAAAGVTSTHVGHLTGVSSNIQTQLNAITSDITQLNTDVAAAVPSGMIMMWSGASNAIPSGYVLCDGTNSTPDLRDRFVVGAGSTYAVGATGGSASVTLTTAQLPAHTHTYTDSNVLQQSLPSGGIDIDFNNTTWDPNGLLNKTTGSTGSGSSHENRPPYYSLCYVMKT